MENLGKDEQWFDDMKSMVDVYRRPYVLIAVDEQFAASGQVVSPGPAEVYWASTITREAAIDLVKGFLRQLEEHPELLVGVDEVVS